MTAHFPSRRLLIPVGAFAVAGTAAAVVAIYWRTILLWAMLAAGVDRRGLHDRHNDDAGSLC